MDRERTWSAGIILLVAALVIAFGLGGCQAIDRFVSMKDDFKAKEVGQTKNNQLNNNGVPTNSNVIGTAAQTNIPPENAFEARLFFADAKGQNLVMEKRTISKAPGIARAVVQEMIKGPSVQTHLLPTIPAGTRLLDINVKNGVCIVNLSKELVKNNQGGSTAEALTVYSLVNTLTQFPTVDKVQILVEGQKVETLVGHVDVSQAMAANKTMIMPETPVNAAPPTPQKDTNKAPTTNQAPAKPEKKDAKTPEANPSKPSDPKAPQ